MGGLAQTRHFAHFEFDIGFEHALGERAALGQESVVGSQAVQCLVQAVADGRDHCVLFRRQVVQVFGGSFARVDFVFHAVQARHHQRREAQVGVHEWIGEARLNTPTFGVGHKGDTDRCRAVTRGIGQLDRRLIARNQALVAVGAGVGDGVEGAGVLDDAADVVQGEVGQTGIAVAGEQVFTVFPDGLVYMHARAIVANDRLGHKGGGFTEVMGNVLHHVLQDLGPVGAFLALPAVAMGQALASSWGTRHDVIDDPLTFLQASKPPRDKKKSRKSPPA